MSIRKSFILIFFILYLLPINANISVRHDLFYTHNNHLGSAAWITRNDGKPIQYIHYLTYGQLLANQMATGYDERFKFIGKERDISHGAPVEVYLNGESGDISCPPIKRSGIGICNLIVEREGYDYFGARYYASPFMHWLSPDPLSDKDPGISSYAYCKWNPVKYIDEDGKRSKLSINGQTITISAKYYATQNDSRYAMKAANFWNNQKGLTYTAKDGAKYSVQFALNVYSSKSPENAAGTDDNSFKIVNTLGTNAEGYKRTGLTEANYKISIVDAYKEESTSAHEIGHTLMNVQEGKGSEHSENGIMTMNFKDERRSWTVPQETVNKIVESNGFNQNNQTLFQTIKSWFE